MAGTARHFHRLVHQLLEGTCLLDIGSRWVLVHQVLSGLGDREREVTVVWKFLFGLIKMRQGLNTAYSNIYTLKLFYEIPNQGNISHK